MPKTPRILRPTPSEPWEPLAYADGLTAAQYIEGDGDAEPLAIPQETNWKED